MGSFLCWRISSNLSSLFRTLFSAIYSRKLLSFERRSTAGTHHLKNTNNEENLKFTKDYTIDLLLMWRVGGLRRRFTNEPEKVEKTKTKVLETGFSIIARLQSLPMEKPPYFSQKKDDPDFSLREWTVKARISRENSISRRFSGSYIRSFREDGGSFRSNFTISSTASSPGYTLRDEIDPSTYSFTTALKALQAKSCYNIWEYLSPEGFALNSKWNEAEKYICNPLSGEVPLECLSAKTLSGRSFRKLTNRITMSAPLVYSTHLRNTQTKPSSLTPEDVIHHFPIPEKKLLEVMTRDVGTQSTPPELSSSSLSPTSTPPIVERALKRCELEADDSPNSTAQMKSPKEVGKKEGGEEERERGEKKKWRESGCLSWMRKRQREKHKPRRRNLVSSLRGC